MADQPKGTERDDTIEYDKLFDHEYDGIQEYDNPMPRWWKALFWASFVFALFYWAFYQMGDGTSVAEGYEQDAQVLADKKTEALLKLGKIDEVLLATFMDNKKYMSEGQQIFVKNCTQCHKADGSGDIGPNLTDSYWIGSNTLEAIYHVVKDGGKVLNKPGETTIRKMPAWSKRLSPVDVIKVAAYVGTLRGKNLAGKGPEGAKLPPAPLPDLKKKMGEEPKPEKGPETPKPVKGG